MKVAVIGAGPAGLFVSSQLKYSEVTIFESNTKPGVKLNITGKGRCNITNACTVDEFLENVVTNPRFLYSAMRAFSPNDTIETFEKNGLELVTERGRRVFPKSGKAQDVTATLINMCKNGRTKFVYQKVRDVKTDGDGFIVVQEDGSENVFDRVVLCTGGVSYPETGSNGSGFEIAKNLGHTISDLYPALVPIETNEDVSSLAFLDLKNVKVKAVCGKKTYEEFGDAEFFKKGLCGPTVLSLSSKINKTDLNKTEIYLDLKPALSEETLENRLLREFSKKENKTVEDVARTLLPSKMISYYLSYCKILANKRVDRVTKEERRALMLGLKSMKFTIKRLSDISRGIVTCGGVNVKEINPTDMQSKKVKGLYFAGEIIDVDALTGGYNIQIALSTAKLVAESVNKEEKEKQNGYSY
ncbi:MAG: NAD(P)/FAD-dependent oxidoreductase [Clostridiales bacterium]|nr:NAD(P)/FAD-dependent oxidoreductase [Clostridiales bacterium]